MAFHYYFCFEENIVFFHLPYISSNLCLLTLLLLSRSTNIIFTESIFDEISTAFLNLVQSNRQNYRGESRKMQQESG